MNYYEHHIGDYAQATAHLSFVEDAAYSRLIRKYYAEERPLPADLKAVQRLVAARTKEEREAVQVVLEEFFTLEADGWHNKRCDQVIAEYKEGEPDREARRANAVERQKRTRERRAAIFKLLAEHGIHPDWNASMTELRALERSVTGANVTSKSQPVTLPVTCDATATHTPDTIPNRTAEAVQGAQHPQPANVVSLTPVNRTAFAQAVAGEYGKAYGVAPPPVPLMLAMEIAARAEWEPRAADLSWWADYFATCWEDLFLTNRDSLECPLGPKAATFKRLVSEECMADMIDRSRREAAHG